MPGNALYKVHGYSAWRSAQYQKHSKTASAFSVKLNKARTPLLRFVIIQLVQQIHNKST